MESLSIDIWEKLIFRLCSCLSKCSTKAYCLSLVYHRTFFDTCNYLPAEILLAVRSFCAFIVSKVEGSLRQSLAADQKPDWFVG